MELEAVELVEPEVPVLEVPVLEVPVVAELAELELRLQLRLRSFWLFGR